VEKRKQTRGWHQHFLGFRARLNCEKIPVIPARLARNCLDDPRKIPHLLVWKDERNGEIKEAVRLARYADPHDSSAAQNHIELKRSDGSSTLLSAVWRTLPRNGGRALFLMCHGCEAPRRFIYGWEWDAFSGHVRRIGWQCRTCAELRYSSEGGHLHIGGPFRALGKFPRPALWLPHVFESAEEALEAGVCSLGDQCSRNIEG
jgi:hypothetical protein